MKESFLHFVWQHGLFDPLDMKTTHGESVIIQKRGFLNSDSGPDFFDSRMIINGDSWTGNTEMHLKASDWNLHKHQSDPAYNNTILHAVWVCDTDVKRMDGSIVPCIELKNRIPLHITEKYHTLECSLNHIPCAIHNPGKYEIQISGAMHRALVDRLLIKSERMLKLARENQNDWQTIFYMNVARYLGFKVNREAMETLARITPQNLLARCKTEPLQIEAMLFGQAGFLQGNQPDAYSQLLKKEYLFLQKKYQLQSMDLAAWKFMRMRPANFPTIRIAQLAALVQKSAHLFSKVLDENDPEKLKLLFSAEAGEYWQNHYRFGVPTVSRSKKIGESTLDGLIINAVVPALFTYGTHTCSEVLKEKAFDLLSVLTKEDNRITREYEQLGFPNKNAYESQALLGLRENYCEKKRCHECTIGMRIISA